MNESQKPRHSVPRKLSAFATARDSASIQAEISTEDVLKLKPEWSREQAQTFLRQHTDLIGQEMVLAGAMLLAGLIEGSEHAN